MGHFLNSATYSIVATLACGGACFAQSSWPWAQKNKETQAIPASQPTGTAASVPWHALPYEPATIGPSGSVHVPLQAPFPKAPPVEAVPPKPAPIREVWGAVGGQTKNPKAVAPANTQTFSWDASTGSFFETSSAQVPAAVQLPWAAVATSPAPLANTPTSLPQAQPMLAAKESKPVNRASLSSTNLNSAPPTHANVALASQETSRRAPHTENASVQRIPLSHPQPMPYQPRLSVPSNDQTLNGIANSQFARVDQLSPSATLTNQSSPAPQAIAVMPMHALPADDSRALERGDSAASTQQPTSAASPAQPTEPTQIVLQDIQVLDAAVSTGQDEQVEIIPFKRLISSNTAIPVQGGLSTAQMTGPMTDATVLFSKLNIENDFRHQVSNIPADVRIETDPVGYEMPWTYQEFAWVTPTFSHRPLYFEQPNLERYGQGGKRCLQPLYSSAHFYGAVLLLPYKIAAQRPNEVVYTLGHRRPGDIAPHQGGTLLGQAPLFDGE
ncbi:MAG: hypothetical protein KDB22_19965 [Planctomycetales bacterium]|nr:hypothetical protein [Planctomycetales bacterium]